MCAFKLFGRENYENEVDELGNTKIHNEERQEQTEIITVHYPCEREFEVSPYLIYAREEFIRYGVKIAKDMPFPDAGVQATISAYKIAAKMLGWGWGDLRYTPITPPWFKRKDWVVKYSGPAKLTTVADFEVPRFSVLTIWGVIAKGKPLADEIWVGVNDCEDAPMPFDRNAYKRFRVARLPVMIFVQGDHVRIKAVTYETGEHLTEEMEFVGMVFYRPYAIDEIREVLEG